MRLCRKYTRWNKLYCASSTWTWVNRFGVAHHGGKIPTRKAANPERNSQAILCRVSRNIYLDREFIFFSSKSVTISRRICTMCVSNGKASVSQWANDVQRLNVYMDGVSVAKPFASFYMYCGGTVVIYQEVNLNASPSTYSCFDITSCLSNSYKQSWHGVWFAPSRSQQAEDHVNVHVDVLVE